MTSVRLERAIPAPSRAYRAMPDLAKNMRPGWESALERLANLDGADR